MRKFQKHGRNLRLNNLVSPQYRHLLLLLGWVGYLIMYYLTETMIPAERCYLVHCWLDDIIPFCEWFLIPYVAWYGLIVVSLLYFLFYNVENFKGLQIYFIIVQVLATLIYIFLPTRQDLRPEIFPRENILTEMTAYLYRIDTNTGVCPSLHVACSLGIASAWLKEREASWVARCLIVLLVVLICLSVVFVKQHSALDIFAALPLCFIAEWIAYGKRYWKKQRV